MPPRGQNTKKEGGKAKKAENEEKKKQSAAAAKVWDLLNLIELIPTRVD
jgi:hypothetical protein